MIEEFTEEMAVDDRRYRYYPEPGHPDRYLVDAGRAFRFRLCRNARDFGGIPIRQTWMSRKTLFPDRKRPAPNYRSIVQYFWAQCWKEDAVLDDKAQEVYILANLLPFARGNAAQRVFRDASPGRGTSDPAYFNSVRDLNKLLRDGRDGKMGAKEFHYHTANALGPRGFTVEEWKRYRTFADELLGQGRQALEHWGDAGLKVPENTWCNWMRTIGRRAKNEDRKLILDVLSVEIRAAFFQCYGVVWCGLLPHLAQKYAMTDKEFRFHEIWHLPYRTESDESSDLHFHAFHGCPFALHPAVDYFVQTTTGHQLIHDVLVDPGNDDAFYRVLNGIYTATIFYTGQLGDCAAERKHSREITFEEDRTADPKARRPDDLASD